MNRGLTLETSIGLNSNNDIPVAITGTEQMFESVVDQITVIIQLRQKLKLFWYRSTNFRCHGGIMGGKRDQGRIHTESDTEVTISREEEDR